MLKNFLPERYGDVGPDTQVNIQNVNNEVDSADMKEVLNKKIEKEEAIEVKNENEEGD